MTPEEQLRVYESDVTPEANIRKSITDAYHDLRPELEALRTYEGQQFPAFYDAFHGYGAGTSASDLAPSTLLQNAWGNVGRKSATAQVARDVVDVRRNAMEDLIRQGLDQWKHGYMGAQNQHDRWWREQQAEEDRRRWEEQMALQREAMRRAGSRGTPGINVTPPGGMGGTGSYQEYLAGIYNQGGSVDPMTGQRIVGMSLPGGQQLYWTVPNNTSGTTSASKAPTSTGPTTSVGQNLVSGYSAPAPTQVSTGSTALDSIVNRIR